MIKPIRSQSDHEAALARIDQIFWARPGTPEFDELDVLATLVEAYEHIHYPIDPPTPVEAIKFAMDQGRFTRADLTKLFGSTARVAEVLNEQRALSKAMIVKLHQAHAIPYDVLLSDIVRIHAPVRRKAASKAKKALRAQLAG